MTVTSTTGRSTNLDRPLRAPGSVEWIHLRSTWEPDRLLQENQRFRRLFRGPLVPKDLLGMFFGCKMVQVCEARKLGMWRFPPRPLPPTPYAPWFSRSVVTWMARAKGPMPISKDPTPAPDDQQVSDGWRVRQGPNRFQLVTCWTVLAGRVFPHNHDSFNQCIACENTPDTMCCICAAWVAQQKDGVM